MQRGYPEPITDAEDRRRRPMRLTARGDDALLQSERILGEVRDELAEAVGPQLDVALDVLETMTGANPPTGLRPIW